MVHVTWGKNTVFNPPATPPASTSTSTSMFTPATPKPTSTFSFGPATTSVATPTTAASTFAPTTASTATSTPTAFSFSSNPVSTPSTPAASPFFSSMSSSTPTANTANTSSFFSPSTATTTTQTAPATSPYLSNVSLGAPQQAAIQAHFNATLHQESSQLYQQLLQLHNSYNPSPCPQQQQPQENHFQYIFYDQMTPSQHYEKLSLGSTYPQKPHSISPSTWNLALSSNPNPDQYIPILITNANELHSRIVTQQSTTNIFSNYITTLNQYISTISKNHNQMMILLRKHESNHEKLKIKLMKVMKKIDLCRGKYTNLQHGEIEIMKKLKDVWNQVNYLGEIRRKCQLDCERFVESLKRLEEMKRYYSNHNISSSSSRSSLGDVNVNEDNMDVTLSEEYKQQVNHVLDQCSRGIEELKISLKKDQRDLKIVKQGVWMK